MGKPTCGSCGRERPDGNRACPHCAQAGARRESSGSANVIALLVVIFLLVVVGYYSVAPEPGMAPARASTEAAGPAGAGAGATVKATRLMENPAAARAVRTLPNALRSAPALRR